MRSKNTLLASFILLFTILIVIVMVLSNASYTRNITWQPYTQYSIISNSHFEEIWSSTAYLDCQTCLLAKNNELYLVGVLKQNNPLSLIKLEVSTGEVDWEQPINEKSEVTHSWLSSNQIYIGFRGTQKIGSLEQLWGASRVTAHELRSGNQLWSSRIPGANNNNYLSATNEKVFVIGSQYLNLVTLDSKTGKVEESDNNSFPLFENDGVSYQKQGALINAIELESGKLIWQLRQSFTEFTVWNETLLLKTGNEVGKVVAIDIRAGKILWEQTGIASNIAADNGVVYFLSLLNPDKYFGIGGSDIVEVHLIAFDIKTGTIMSSLNFEPSIILIEEIYTYSVAASNDLIVVYLGGGGQLFVIRYVP